MTIKLHDLRPAPGSKTKRTRVGRGEGSKGKTAGRGTKGTKARKNVPVTFEGGQMPIHMRLPKLKGFKNRFRTEYEVVNVGDINRLFPEGGAVGVDELVAKGAVRKNGLVKVLGDGKLSVKVDLSAHKFSGSAREKITAAIAKNELPMPEAGAMSYMMSKAGNLGDSVGHWCPHLMFHVPKTDDASWGADLAGSPVLFNDEYRDVPEPETIFMVRVSHWSDGTAAPHQASD